jgi:hypothetical protein
MKRFLLKKVMLNIFWMYTGIVLAEPVVDIHESQEKVSHDQKEIDENNRKEALKKQELREQRKLKETLSSQPKASANNQRVQTTSTSVPTVSENSVKQANVLDRHQQEVAKDQVAKKNLMSTQEARNKEKRSNMTVSFDESINTSNREEQDRNNQDNNGKKDESLTETNDEAKDLNVNNQDTKENMNEDSNSEKNDAREKIAEARKALADFLKGDGYKKIEVIVKAFKLESKLEKLATGKDITIQDVRDVYDTLNTDFLKNKLKNINFTKEMTESLSSLYDKISSFGVPDTMGFDFIEDKEANKAMFDEIARLQKESNKPISKTIQIATLSVYYFLMSLLVIGLLAVIGGMIFGLYKLGKKI